MTDLDPELAAVLRASADRRIAEQIRQAAARRQAEADTRAEFQVRRAYAKSQLHAARQQLISHHKEKTMTKPELVSRQFPDSGICASCGNPCDWGHYAAETPDGPLCQICANRVAPGLGDAARGLSLIKLALIYNIEQEQRPAIIHHLAEIQDLAVDILDGNIVFGRPDEDGEVQPDRPGGDDPHATIRRSFIRPVGDAE